MDTRELAAWLSERLDKLEGKVDGVGEHCARIDVTLASQAKDIAHHISRTDALEDRVEQVAAEVKPLRDMASKLRGVMAFVGLVGVLIGIWATLSKIAG